jgi:glucose-6-phosphate isomerase
LLLEAVDFRGYTSIHAYLDRDRDMAFESLRGVIAMKTSRPTTFGWGPRFLHSTGQYHKGGPAQGIFLQLIGETSDELLVPNRNFGFQELMNSQAAGDANVLAAVGRPVLTLRFQDAAGALLVISNTLNEL